jgi:hypothetical protein
LPPLEPELPPPLPEEQEPEAAEPELPPPEAPFQEEPSEEEEEYPAGLPDQEESLDDGIPEETGEGEEITEESGEEPEEENPEDEIFFPEDTALELSPDEEESIFSDEIPEDLTAGSEDSFLDLEPEPAALAEEPAVPAEEPVAEEEPAAPAEEPAAEEVLETETEENPDGEIIPIEETLPQSEAPLEDELILEKTTAEDEPVLVEKVVAPGDFPGPKSAKPMAAEDIARLLNHLKELAHELPGKDADCFFNSDVRLSLEFLIDVLRGRKGLYKDIKERIGETPEKEDPVGMLLPVEVAGTLTYLGQLASALPDQKLSAAITRKTGAVIAEITQSGETKVPVKKG